jgi:hypothetical protein
MYGNQQGNATMNLAPSDLTHAIGIARRNPDLDAFRIVDAFAARAHVFAMHRAADRARAKADKAMAEARALALEHPALADTI